MVELEAGNNAMRVCEAEAILFGLALGDALGAPTEFLKLPEIKQQYGARGIQEPPDPALYTDDTQMTLASDRRLARCRSWMLISTRR